MAWRRLDSGGNDPEVKQAIADEVKAQLAGQQAQAQSAGPAVVKRQRLQQRRSSSRVDRQSTFVVDSDLSVVSNGQECGLTAGDVITRLTDTPMPTTWSTQRFGQKKSELRLRPNVAVK